MIDRKVRAWDHLEVGEEEVEGGRAAVGPVVPFGQGGQYHDARGRQCTAHKLEQLPHRRGRLLCCRQRALPALHTDALRVSNSSIASHPETVQPALGPTQMQSHNWR